MERRMERVPMWMEVSGPRRVPRKRKKELKGSYVALLIAVAEEQFKAKHGPHHHLSRYMRRLFRQVRFRWVRTEKNTNHEAPGEQG